MGCAGSKPGEDALMLSRVVSPRVYATRASCVLVCTLQCCTDIVLCLVQPIRPPQQTNPPSETTPLKLQPMDPQHA